MLRQWLAGAVLYGLSFAVAAETLTIVADKWCPYNCEPGSDRPGFMIEIAQRALSKHGISVNYELVPWSRALHGTRLGHFDAAVGAARVEAPQLIYPETEQGQMQNAIWTLAGQRFPYQGIESLNNRILAYMKGYSYGPQLDAYIQDTRNHSRLHALFGTTPLADAIKMLEAGRVDALVEDANVLRFYLQSYPEVSMAMAGKVASDPVRQRVYIALSPELQDASRYARWLSEGTQALRRSGELATILDRYGVKDWR